MIRVKGDKAPECKVCGQKLPCEDIQFDHNTGDTWYVVKPCPNPACIFELNKDRLNPKHFIMGRA